MANYYIYLISSLPSLGFGQKPPLSYGAFLKACDGLVSDVDIAILRSLADPGRARARAENVTLKRWLGFEIMLRNELVRVRASRKKVDPEKYLRQDGCPESVYTAHFAVNAYRRPALLDGARALDLDRWQYLDELSMGHYFDLDMLIIYACKLLILEKWHAVGSADGGKVMEEELKL